MSLSKLSKVLHDEVGSAAVYVSPLLAPLPSAWAILTATGSITLAVAVEGLGFAAAFAALRTYNEQRSMFRFAMALCAVYLVAVFSVLMGAKVLPVTAEYMAGETTVGAMVVAWGTLAYPLLTFVGAGVFAIIEQLDAVGRTRLQVQRSEVEREALHLEMERRRAEQALDIERAEADAKIRLRMERERAKLLKGTSQNLSQVVSRETAPGVSTSEGAGDVLRIIETAVRRSPDIGLRALGEAAGVSKDTAGRMLKSAGWHKNGNGWEKVNE